MFQWAFSKVVNIRNKVAKDLKREDAEKPFLDHLEDLRTMLVRIAMTLAVFVLGTFIFYNQLWEIVKYPLVLAHIEDRISFQQIEPVGGFMAVMNLSIVAGIVISSPLLIYFVLQFVLPGLRNTEKKVLFPSLAVGGGLFMMGAMFAYFLVAPRALTFFQEFNARLSVSEAPAKPMMLEVDLTPFKNLEWLHLPSTTLAFKATPVKSPQDKIIWGISHYVKFICQFILIFGLCFELPVVVMALVKLDILSYKVMKGTRNWALAGIAVISMIVAPSPDVFTLALIAVPLYLLYEVCIWIAWWIEKRDRALYPDHYKALDEDAKLLEGTQDWDNENYNPWGDESDEENHASATPRLADTHPVHEHTELTPPAEPPQEGAAPGAAPAAPEPPAEIIPPGSVPAPEPKPEGEGHDIAPPQDEELKHDEPKPNEPPH